MPTSTASTLGLVALHPKHLDGRILIVDDQKFMISLLETNFRAAGYAAISSTTDAGQAVKLCQELAPDLMLLDLHMPVLDGFEVLARLRALGEAALPPVLILTGDDNVATRIRALEAGARDFVAKPFEKTELLSRARNLIQMRQFGKALTAANHDLEREVRKRTEQLEAAVTVLRQAEAKLGIALRSEQTNSQNKSELLANVVHELRTPLTAVLGFSEILRDDPSKSIEKLKVTEYAGNIHEAAQHALNVVGSMLDLARAEAGQLDLELREVDAEETAQATVRMLSGLAGAAGLELKVKFAKDFPRIKTDERRLRQVLINIVTNAIKFTPAGGNVTVEGKREGDGAIILVVSDSGIGIAREDIVTAMRPFGQVQSAQKQGREGTGLGLPLTKKLVEALGGSFKLDSTVGVGTTVTIRFPAELVIPS